MALQFGATKTKLNQAVQHPGVILKVPHHGASGLDADFLLAVRPKIAVISCGRDNRYGHPASETLSLLERAGCRVVRTDEEGTVTVDLHNLEIITER